MKELLDILLVAASSAFAGYSFAGLRASKRGVERAQEQRHDAERAALADMSEALRQFETETSVVMFDGETVQRVSYQGPRLNSHGGSA